MRNRVFLDTNILLYADDASAGPKQRAAQNTLAEAQATGTGVISTQVLQEFIVNASRKLALDGADIRERVDRFLGFEIITVGVEHILGATDLQRLRGWSFWDALIVTAAVESGCDRLLSEDLQHGFKVRGLVIQNPFLDLVAG